MSATVIIPARYASTRLPGKPLLKETGKYLIQHVVDAASKASKADRIVVATDDERIYQAVEEFQGQVVMTRADHQSGTDRLAEAAEILSLADDDIVINVQGDEPDMPAECIDMLVDMMSESSVAMATFATPLSAQDAADPNKVKVVLRRDGRAMYFSRSRIPYDRDNAANVEYLLHLGIYAYRVSFLKEFAALSPTVCEQTECLEQLRALEHGYDILVAKTDYDGHGIDTPEDYAEFLQSVRGSHTKP